MVTRRVLDTSARLVLMACALALPTCSGKKVTARPTFPVRGQVLYEGRPVFDALVVFHPQTPLDNPPVQSFARTDAQGFFEMSTYQANDGVPPGAYRVSVVKQNEDDGSFVLPGAYADPARSGLRVDVREGANELEPFRLRWQ